MSMNDSEKYRINPKTIQDYRQMIETIVDFFMNNNNYYGYFKKGCKEITDEERNNKALCNLPTSRYDLFYDGINAYLIKVFL